MLRKKGGEEEARDRGRERKSGRKRGREVIITLSHTPEGLFSLPE